MAPKVAVTSSQEDRQLSTLYSSLCQLQPFDLFLCLLSVPCAAVLQQHLKHCAALCTVPTHDL